MSFQQQGSASNNARYDKYLEHQDQTPLGKLQKQYWTTKQKVIQKLGKEEDEYVVLSDAELDAKLDLFRSVKINSNELLRIIEHYQDKICQLSMVEAEMSRFLKEYSQYDKTRAGKMMASVSKAQNYSAQQRMSLRVPLTRLYNEVETFRYRAITDTWWTIRKMEQARTEYRGALLWMKDVSSELDPDTSKKLEKFRRVQAQVKLTKTKFDRHKVDVQQKVDLLLASRCNMFSNVLFNYQQNLIQFWQKTSKTMNAIADAFKGYQYYEFNIIKDLIEPSKKLAGLSANQATTTEVADKKVENEKQNENETEVNTNTEYSTDNEEISEVDENGDAMIDEDLIKFDESNVKEENVEQLVDIPKYNEDNIVELIDMITQKDVNSLNEQLKELELLEKTKTKLKTEQKKQQQQQQNENADEYDENLIKNLINTSNDEFEKEWQSVFTTSRQSTQPVQSVVNEVTNNESLINITGTSQDLSSSNFLFPSQLLANSSILQPQNTSAANNSKSPNENNKLPIANKKSNKKDMSTWYNLFADLDPIQNPDAIGSKKEVEEERNC